MAGGTLPDPGVTTVLTGGLAAVGVVLVVPAPLTGRDPGHWHSASARVPSCAAGVHGRKEFWEDSPTGWPQHWGSRGDQFQQDGRPTAQWSRIRAGRDDDLGTGHTG
jgi:hypothetical protein